MSRGELQDERDDAETIGMMKAILLVGAAAVVVCAGVIGYLNSPAAAQDASGKLACLQFEKLDSDAHAGTLTDVEVRDRFIRIADNARLSTSTSLRDGAQHALAAATSRDRHQLAIEIVGLRSICGFVH